MALPLERTDAMVACYFVVSVQYHSFMVLLLLYVSLLVLSNMTARPCLTCISESSVVRLSLVSLLSLFLLFFPSVLGENGAAP